MVLAVLNHEPELTGIGIRWFPEPELPILDLGTI
jgi:hypothetical protein